MTRLHLLSLTVLTFIGVDPAAAQEGPAAGGDSSTPAAPVQESDQDVRVDVGGYGSFRYEAGGAADESITLRRLVITTDARLGRRFKAYSEVEYERLSEIEVERAAEREDGGLTFEQEIEGISGSELALEQAWVQLDFGSIGARFGAILPPVGRFNIAHDDNLWNFPRRPLADRGAQVLPVSGAWTEMGFGLLGQHEVGEGGVLSWQAYVVNGVTLDFALEHKIEVRPGHTGLVQEAEVRPTQGAFDGSSRTDAVTGRIAFSPALGSELAVSGYTGPYTPEYLDVDARLSTVGVDGRTRIGPLVAEGEYLRTSYGKVQAVAADFARVTRAHSTAAEVDGLETEVELELKGLADHRSGLWHDLSWPIALAPGALGFESAVIAPIARYEQVWLDGALEEMDFAGGQVTELERGDRTQQRIAAGLAFRPLPQAVVQIVYERNHAVTGAVIDPATEERATNGFVVGVAVGF